MSGSCYQWNNDFEGCYPGWGTCPSLSSYKLAGPVELGVYQSPRLTCRPPPGVFFIAPPSVGLPFRATTGCGWPSPSSGNPEAAPPGSGPGLRPLGPHLEGELEFDKERKVDRLQDALFVQGVLNLFQLYHLQGWEGREERRGCERALFFPATQK